MKTHQTKCHICQQAAKNQQWDAIFLICLLQCCTAHTFTCSIFLLSIHVRSLFRWSNLYTMTATAVGLGFLNVDPDPRIHLSVIVDPDPVRRQNEMDPKRWRKVILSTFLWRTFKNPGQQRNKDRTCIDKRKIEHVNLWAVQHWSRRCGSGYEYLFFIFFIKKFMLDKLKCLFLLPPKFRKGISQITETFSFTFYSKKFWCYPDPNQCFLKWIRIQIRFRGKKSKWIQIRIWIRSGDWDGSGSGKMQWIRIRIRNAAFRPYEITTDRLTKQPTNGCGSNETRFFNRSKEL